MDNIVSLLTTTAGRISRKQWWIGVLIMIVLGIVVSLILSAVGLGMWPPSTVVDPDNPQALADTVSAATRNAGWASLISFIILAYPGYCISMKRRHDKDNNGRDLQIYFGLTLLLLLLQALGIGYSQTAIPGVEGVTVATPGLITGALGIVVGIFAIYLLVVLGFLKGTAGANTYGPDPLGGTVV